MSVDAFTKEPNLPQTPVSDGGGDVELNTDGAMDDDSEEEEIGIDSDDDEGGIIELGGELR